jgi:hypothetical protein
MAAIESNYSRPEVEAKALFTMYKRHGSSGVALFELVIPRTLKDCAGDARSFEFRRAVLREFVGLVKRHRMRSTRAGGGRSTRKKHVRRGSAEKRKTWNP